MTMTRAGYRMERRYNFRAMQRGKERGGGKKVAWNEGKINRPLIPKGTGYITYVYIYIRAELAFQSGFAAESRGHSNENTFSRINPRDYHPLTLLSLVHEGVYVHSSSKQKEYRRV